MKDTFIVRTEWSDAIFELSAEDKATTFDNLFHYHLGNENLINLNNLTVKLVWKLIQPNLIRNIDQYDKRRETSLENGKKGGRPKKEVKTDENNLNNLNNNLNNLTKPNVTLSVSDSDSDSDSVIVNDLKKNNSYVEISKIEITDHTQNEIIFSPILKEPIKTDSEKEKEKSSAKKEKEWVDGQGDGELHELLKGYYLNPLSPKYEADMYKKFKAYWTAIVRVGTGKGKEFWRTEKTFNISLRLSTWKNNELRTANNWGKGAKPIPLAPTGTEPTNGRAFGKL